MDISTSVSSSPTRKYSISSHELPSVRPNKYKQIFAEQERLGQRGCSPNTRIKDNSRQIKLLRGNLSNEIYKSCFFTYGTQKNDPHFKELFQDFTEELKGSNPIINKAASELGRKFPNYKDVSRLHEKVTVDEYSIDRDITQSPTIELLAELQELFDQRQGLQQDLLLLLKKNHKKLVPELKLHDWETTHAHGGNVDTNYFLIYLLKKTLLNLRPSFYQQQKEICTKLLEIAWLEKDMDQVKLYLSDNNSPMKSPNASPIKIKDPLQQHIWKEVFKLEDVPYEICETKADGACGLHALLGTFSDGEWQYVGTDVKQVFLNKLEEPEHETLIREILPKIIRGHLHATDDDSSNMLFGHAVGQGIKTAYVEIEAAYRERLERLNTQKANEWITLFNRGSFQAKLLEEARGLGNEQYEGKSDREILETLRQNPLKMLSLISANTAPFLLECSHDKSSTINRLSEEYDRLQEERFIAENDFIIREIYPLYAYVLQHPAFYLNTEELELAALLFNEKMQVISVDEQGNAHPVIDLVNEHLDKETTVIHHTGLHFSRCKPSTEEDYEAYELQSNYSKAKQRAQKAVERDKALSEKFWSSVKEETSQLAVSGALSLGTWNPLFIGRQAAMSSLNVVGHYVDPENKSTVMQLSKLLTGAGIGKFIGGNPVHIAQGLAVDIVNMAKAPETKKEDAALRNIGIACVKGVVTLDPVKFAENALGGVLAEGGRAMVPEEKVNDPTYLRLARAAFTNSDLHGLLVDSIVKDPPKKESKPKVEGTLSEEEQAKYPKQVLTEIETEQPQTHIEPEMHDPNGYQLLLLEEKNLQATLEKLQNDLIIPKSTLEQAQKAVDDNQAKIDKYAKKGGNSAYEKTLHYKEKGYKRLASRNVAQGAVDKITNKIAEVSDKIAGNQKAQAEASAPKHINPPAPKIHIIADQKTKKNHHLHYFDDSGQKQSLGKYGNADDARFISGAFTQFETERFSQESRCFDGQRQLVESGISIDDVPKRPVLETPTFEGNNADKNFQKLQETRIRNERRVQEYIKQIEQLVGKTITAQGLTKTQVNQISQQVAPKIKEIKQHGFWFNAWRAPGRALKWLDDHGVSLSVNVDYSMPLYQTKTPSTTPSYTGSYGYGLPKHEPIISSTWENVQQMVAGQVFQANMAYQSPVQQPTLDYQQFWGQGLNPNVQIPPSDWSNLGKSEPTLGNALPRVSGKAVQMAGFMPFAISKIVPEQTQKNIKTWVKNYIQEWKDDPLKARKDLDVCLILGAKKAVVIAIQAFEQPSLKTRPNTFGLMEVSDRCDRFIAGKLNVDLDSKNAQLGMFVGEFFAPMGMMGKTAKPVMKVGQEAFVFMRQSAKLMRPQPLMDRALALPQGFSKEIRAIEALQNPVYRSGFVHNKAIQQARKAVNLPSWKTIHIKMKHILEGHTNSGWRTGCKGNNKTLFPDGFSNKQLEKVIRQAYRYGKKTRTQGEKVVVVGEYQGIKIKMYINTEKKIIETAFPVQ